MRLPILFAAASFQLLAADPPPTVAVTGGRVEGVYLERGGAVFKGVPFAQPPVGDLRWREPQPVKPWTATREATKFGAACAQNSGGKMLETSKEDCLFLNVWTPDFSPKSRLAVMVWIHGGGNYGGTASGNNFDGEKLARHGVVVVSTNYRLTAFGFLAHPELTKESPHHASGNYGLLDQIAALKWVHENISKFGGDPGSVTVFGQSAGAVDANVLMTSPLTKGLFHRVIAESGTVTRVPEDATMRMTALGVLMGAREGAPYSDALNLADAEKSGLEFGRSLKQLRELPAEEILKKAAAPRMSIGPANGIVSDGYVFPKPPAEVFVKGQEHRLPLLLGNNSRERTPPDVTPESLHQAIEAMYGPLAPKALSLYPSKDPDPLYGAAPAQWVVDTMYRCPVVAQLVWHASAGNPSFEYQFDHAAPGREAAGSTHGAEVGFVFGTLGAQYPAGDQELSASIQQYWTNFAKTGNPNGPNLAQWPKFDVSARGYMEFTDAGPAGREGLRRPFCDLYVENMTRLIRK